MRKTLFAELILIFSAFTSCGNLKINFDKPTSEAVKSENTTVSESTLSLEKHTDEKNSDNKRGIIFDTNGKALIYTDSQDNEYRYMPEEYVVPFSNIISDISSGLDTTLAESLRRTNSEPVDIYNSIGQSVQLTINADMQSDIYSVMESENATGTVVVMRTDGSIASMVSYPSYNANLYNSDENYRKTINEKGGLNNKALQKNAPGSCFKIISAILAYKYNITSLNDEGSWNIEGAEIHNWDWNEASYTYPRNNINIYTAFANSSNVFFAKIFNQIGQAAVEKELHDMFLFGDDISIECDFGTLENTLSINNNDNLRRSGFGQANVRTTPIYLAALVREAVYGEMVKPFVIQNYVNTKNYKEILENGSKPYDIIAAINNEEYDYISSMRENMAEVARPLKVSVPDGYSFLAKTGTAEIADSYFTYISGCFINSDDTSEEKIYSDYKDYKSSYIIIFQLQNPEELNFEYASGSAVIYNDIINKVLERKG